MTNFEVLQVLRYNHRYRKRNQEKLNELEEEVKLYLNHTPAKDQRREKLETLKNSLKPLGITKAEFLQIANLMPSTSVELYLIIPNIEERLSETQIADVLKFVKAN